MKQIKIIVEKHEDGYVAYPLGFKGVVVAEGETYEQALVEVKSAIQFHLKTFGTEIAMIRENPDGTRTPLTIPNHPTLKSSTLRVICTQANIPRPDFLRAYERA